MIQGQTLHLSHLHCSSKGPFPSVAQAGVLLPRQIFSLKHWLSRPCLSLRLPPHTPSLATLLCLVSLSHSAPCARGLCLAGALADIGNAAWRGDGLCTQQQGMSLLVVARTDAECHGPCMGGSCCHQQTQLPVFHPRPPWDMNTVTSKGRARLLTVSLELLGGGQRLVTCRLHAGRLQRLFGGLGL